MAGNTPAAPSPLQLPDYSSAYTKIIENRDDLEGIIAYSLYKGQKREFLIANKLSPDDVRIKEYHHDLNDGRVSSLRMLAEKLLQSYAQVIVEGINSQDRKNAADSEIIEKLTTFLDAKIGNLEKTVRSSTVWWKTVIYGAISSFVFALILTAFGFISWTNPFNSIPDRTQGAFANVS